MLTEKERTKRKIAENTNARRNNARADGSDETLTHNKNELSKKAMCMQRTTERREEDAKTDRNL